MSKSCNSPYLVGKKETIKGIRDKRVKKVFIATDCDSYIVDEIIRLCTENGISQDRSKTRSELGKQVGVKIGSAVIGLLK